MILIDTDHLSILADGRAARHADLAARLKAVDDPIAIPVVAVEEQVRAWLAQLRRVRDSRALVDPYARFAGLLEFLCDWNMIVWDAPAADEFDRLRRGRIRIGTQDLKIAAMALSRAATLLSANLRDFERVPGLKVEDWLH